MVRVLFLRLNPNEELLLQLDELKKKLRLPLTSIARIALFEYCHKILKQDKNGENKD